MPLDLDLSFGEHLLVTGANGAGNQRRAQIATTLASNPEILIADEPTNYLDLDTIQALELALAKWDGTLIVASHDHWLIDHWNGRHIHLTPVAQSTC